MRFCSSKPRSSSLQQQAPLPPLLHRALHVWLKGIYEGVLQRQENWPPRGLEGHQGVCVIGLMLGAGQLLQAKV